MGIWRHIFTRNLCYGRKKGLNWFYLPMSYVIWNWFMPLEQHWALLNVQHGIQDGCRHNTNSTVVCLSVILSKHLTIYWEMFYCVVYVCHLFNYANVFLLFHVHYITELFNYHLQKLPFAEKKYLAVWKTYIN